MENYETLIMLIFGVGILLSLYFVPAIIASARNHPHQGTILGLNLLLGWTFFVWIALILWAIVERPSNQWVLDGLLPVYPKAAPWPTAEEETLTREQFLADERKGYMS